MGSHAAGTELEEVLRQQIACAAALSTILLHEQEILPRRETAALNAAAVRKAELIDRLNLLEGRRRRLWPTGPASLDWHRDLQPGRGGATLEALWKSLIAEIRRCRELNEANRQVLNVIQEAVTRALSVLDAPASDATLYGPHGRRTDAPGSHPLAKA